MIPSKYNKFAKYSGLAFQLLAYILVGFFIGKWVDGKMANKEPYGILFFSTIFLIMALYSIVKDVLKSEK